MEMVEAPCEQWMGQLKYLYNPVQGPTTSTMVQRLRARCAGARGDGSDEPFLLRLAQILLPEKHQSQHRDTKMRCLRSWRIAAKTASSSRGSVLVAGPAAAASSQSSLAVAATAAASSAAASSAASACMDRSVLGTGRAAARATSQARLYHEPQILEAADEALLSQVKRRGAAVLPLFASTRSQWKHDLQLTDKDLQTSERAQKKHIEKSGAATKRSVAKHAPSSSSTSEVESTTSSSSSSSTSTCQSRAPQGVAAPAAPSNDRLQWVLPRGGLLHWRVDLSATAYCTACKPDRQLSHVANYGDTAAGAAATGSRWCRSCAKSLGLVVVTSNAPAAGTASGRAAAASTQRGRHDMNFVFAHVSLHSFGAVLLCPPPPPPPTSPSPTPASPNRSALTESP